MTGTDTRQIMCHNKAIDITSMLLCSVIYVFAAEWNKHYKVFKEVYSMDSQRPYKLWPSLATPEC